MTLIKVERLFLFARRAERSRPQPKAFLVTSIGISILLGLTIVCGASAFVLAATPQPVPRNPHRDVMFNTLCGLFAAGVTTLFVLLA